nr:peptidoglycan DD-metalloendopeptidase family protein [Rivibacter subsaxonicus]
MVLLVSGCASSSRKAPVEDRSATRAPTTIGSASGATDTTPKPLPGAENAGKPGYYTVKPGDTMIRIGLETGQNWRDVARWNGIDNANLIEVGQVLRVAPPGADPSVAATKPVVAAKVEPKPLDAPKPGTPGAPGAPAVVAGGTATPAATGNGTSTGAAPASAGGASSPVATREPDDEITWSWPASGALLNPFDETRNKGISLAGKLGDPVLAAADGRVVYAGSGLRGYGNLIIVKHNNTYLTAYAHNKVLLVGDDQPVKRGQKIAEMGSSDAERVQLHFEIRRSGKPIDPIKALPPR